MVTDAACCSGEGRASSFPVHVGYPFPYRIGKQHDVRQESGLRSYEVTTIEYVKLGLTPPMVDV